MTESGRKTVRRWREPSWGYWSGAIVFIVGVSISATGFTVVRDQLEEKARIAFEGALYDHVRVIATGLLRSVSMVESIGDYFAATSFVTASQFDVFTDGLLRRHDGTKALEWIPCIAHDARSAFESDMSAVHPGFGITERSGPGRLVPAETRNEYFPVTYVAPLDGNRAAVGYDLASEESRRRALESARDRKQAIATAPITLVQGDKARQGFLVLNPVFGVTDNRDQPSAKDESLRGFTVGVFVVGDLVDRALLALKPKPIVLRLDDVTDGIAKPLYQRLFPSALKPRAAPADDEAVIFDRTLDIAVAGRRWRINGRARMQDFNHGNRGVQAWTILIAGILLSTLISLNLFSYARSDARIRLLVADRTNELVESRRRLAAVLDTVADGIITIDSRGTILSANPAGRSMFDYGEDELIGNNVKMLVPSPHRERHDTYIGDYLRTGVGGIIGRRRELRGQRKDGTEFPMELAITDVTLANDRIFVGIVRDISDRRQAERTKDQFLANVSHELRTPLTVIKGYLPFLRRAERMPDADSITTMAGKMDDAAGELLELIDSLFDFSRLESRSLKLNFGDVDCEALLEEVAAGFRAKAEAKGLELRVQAAPCIVVADKDRLKRVLHTLMDNAIKFTEAGHATLAVAMDAGSESSTFAVSDTGPGIPQDHRDTIFDRFRQLDGTSTRHAGGAGLGLSIARDLVALHGGEIEVSGTPGQGATFRFRIPLAASRAATGRREDHALVREA